MSYIPPTVERVAKQIARVPGVELSAIARDGAVDAVIEGGYNRPLREQLLGMGHRQMVPVRVFYRMSDGRAIGESEARSYEEALEDYYTDVHVSGFVGSRVDPDPSESGGDAYGSWSAKADDDRDAVGQLKLCRIRQRTRGRPVVGWRYGDKAVRKGDKIKFNRPATLQWTMGRTVNVRPGAEAHVADMSSRTPILYAKMGGRDQIEVPVHALGHIYDVMTSPRLEQVEAKKRSELPPEFQRLVMAVGFGRLPGIDDTPTNTKHFKGPKLPDLHGYAGVGESSESEEDKLVAPPEKADTIKIRKGGEVKQVLLGRDDHVKTFSRKRRS